MSHYDCRNCGHYGGIDWGICESCTPKKYLTLMTELDNMYNMARYRRDKLPLEDFLLESETNRIKVIKETLEQIRVNKK